MLLDDMRPGDADARRTSRRSTARASARRISRASCSLFSRQQVLEPRVLDLNDVLAGMDKMLRRILGEDVELVCARPTARKGPGRSGQHRAGHHEPRRERARRDAHGGKLTMETANVVLDEELRAAHLARSRARTSCSL